MQRTLSSHHHAPVAGPAGLVHILSTTVTSASPLANYLVHPVQNTTPTAPKRSVPRARLFTSDESLALLEQKENGSFGKRKIERAEKKQKRFGFTAKERRKS